MTVTLCNNCSNTNATVNSDNNNNNTNNNNHNNNSVGISGSESAIAPITTSAPSSSSMASVSAEGSVGSETTMVPASNSSSAATLPRPKRDFRFKRVELEQSPKWLVWPNRDKKSKSSTGDDKNNSDGSSSSSGNNNSSHADTEIGKTVLPEASSTMVSESSQTAVIAAPQNGTNLVCIKSNQTQHVIGQRKLSRTTSAPPEKNSTMVSQPCGSGRILQHTNIITSTFHSITNNESKGTHYGSSVVSSLLNIKGARQKRQYAMHYHTLTAATACTSPITIPAPESVMSPCMMRRRVATSVDREHHISGSAPSKQTFKILSVSKKNWVSGDDDDIDLTKS